MNKTIFLLFSCVFLMQNSIAQKIDSFMTHAPERDPKRQRIVAVSGGSAYGLTMLGLNNLWYKSYPRSSFHFFNDAKEWEQMDKLGHAWTAYSIGRAGIDIMNWTGQKNPKAAWIGGSLGWVFLTTIETLDGFSTKWGASASDVAANTSGALLVIGQELAWEEQRALLKFSFAPHSYPASAQGRANELYGKGFFEKLFKDYNGQSYWLSVSPYSFMNDQSKFPKWLNVAVGYGAEGMLGGFDNKVQRTGYIEDFTYVPRYRQYYLSLDVNLSKIKTRSKILNSVLSMANSLKIPAPAIELSRNKLKFHPVYF